jgi:hypothetical protein
MQVLEILNQSISHKEKESQLAALFSYKPPKEEVKDDIYYSGLEDEALSTSFCDYYTIYQDLEGNLIDYGAGYCKGSLLFQALGHKQCMSYEVLSTRINYAKECLRKNNLSLEYIFKRDLLTGPVPIGKNYLIYQPLGKLFFRLLNHLLMIKQNTFFYIIESHGDVLTYLDNLKCFEKLNEFDSQSLRHVAGVHKYLFKPSEINDCLYSRFFTRLGIDEMYVAYDDKQEFEFNLEEALPIFYNSSPCIELLTHKRILDNKIIKLKSDQITLV